MAIKNVRELIEALRKLPPDLEVFHYSEDGRTPPIIVREGLGEDAETDCVLLYGTEYM